MRYILTAQPQALPLALMEAGNASVVRTLEPGVALCEGVGKVTHPVFLRHICPAMAEIPLDGSEGDIAALVQALQPLLDSLGAEDCFSVQTRVIEGFHPAYKRFDVNTALSDAAQQTGARLEVKKPERIISVTLADGAGWLGISTAEENISDWAGGMRRFKWEAGQISRAEFKLLEAIETFSIPLADGQRALDLGAAPGGWTRMLRRRGLYVTAVDPAALDARLAKDRRVTHYRGTAQAFFKGQNDMFDLMVNDMKMDSDQSAALMAQGASCLRAGAMAVLTLKLPENVEEWLPRVAQAREILDGAYDVRGARQLFHNRNEVTLALERR